MNNRNTILALVLTVTAVFAGCTPEPTIVRHRVPKERSGLEKLRQPNSLSQTATPAPTQKTRMAVAIFDNPDATWFFKVSGPAEQVAETESQWMSFFRSVKFEQDEPTWDMPGTWTKSGPKPMRHATLIIGDLQPPLEMAISSLGPDQDLLLNVNRWRGQIGLGPSSQAELDGQIQEHQTDTGKFIVFNAVGTGTGSMRPPFASGGAPLAENQAPTAGVGSESGSSKLKYETPTGWITGRTSSIVHARLTKKVESAEVQITVVEMPADANEWEPNVRRWANQVGLGQLSDKEFAKRTTELTVDGIAGKSIDLIDPESDLPNATVAGMVKREGSAWFLKLSGDKKLVEENLPTFRSFLETLRFN